VSSITTVTGSPGPSSRDTTRRATINPIRSTSHTAAEKNRHAAWNEICWAIRAPANIPTTDRRPVLATSPVASTVNSTNVPRRLNTGRNSSNTPAHDPGKIITGT
jgi:hypothetical protein